MEHTRETAFNKNFDSQLFQVTKKTKTKTPGFIIWLIILYVIQPVISIHVSCAIFWLCFIDLSRTRIVKL